MYEHKKKKKKKKKWGVGGVKDHMPKEDEKIIIKKTLRKIV